MRWHMSIVRMVDAVLDTIAIAEIEREKNVRFEGLSFMEMHITLKTSMKKEDDIGKIENKNDMGYGYYHK